MFYCSDVLESVLSAFMGVFLYFYFFMPWEYSLSYPFNHLECIFLLFSFPFGLPEQIPWIWTYLCYYQLCWVVELTPLLDNTSFDICLLILYIIHFGSDYFPLFLYKGLLRLFPLFLYKGLLRLFMFLWISCYSCQDLLDFHKTFLVLVYVFDVT